MYRQIKALEEMLSPAISALGYEMWGIEYIQQGRGVLLRIYIDAEKGISVTDCSRVSQRVAGILDVEDPIKGHYDLEVSSPGLDRPLFTLEQFSQYIGEAVQIRLNMKLDGRKRFKGNIIEVSGDSLVISEDDNSRAIPTDMIEQARLVPQV